MALTTSISGSGGLLQLTFIGTWLPLESTDQLMQSPTWKDGEELPHPVSMNDPAAITAIVRGLRCLAALARFSDVTLFRAMDPPMV